MAEGEDPSRQREHWRRWPSRVRRLLQAGEREPEQPPTLRLVVVGATSAGKTTLLNGLLGRRVLPSDADELSAGLVAFRPSSGCSELLIGEAAGWNAGRYRLREDGDLERRLRSILFLAQYEGNQGTLEAPPRLEVKLPLSFCGHLLGLHEGYPLELLDAPGLRVQGDSKNLSDITAALKGSLALLVLDASRTMNREELAEMLALLSKHNELVSQGLGPLIVFNKIDRTNAEDRSISIAQQEMLHFCSDVLGREVNMVPLAGLMFQRATELQVLLTRWVTGDVDVQRQHQALLLCLEATIHDTWGALRKLARPNKTERERLSALEDAVMDKQLPVREELQWLATYLGAASGATSLVASLRTEVGRVLEKYRERPSSPLSKEALLVVLEVARMLGLMVRADGVVQVEELALASDLLGDFSLEFFGQDAPVATVRYLERVARGEIFETCSSKVPLPEEVRSWVRNALRSLMAVDRDVHEQEVLLLNKLMQD